jgi:hypothetical protein
MVAAFCEEGLAAVLACVFAVLQWASRLSRLIETYFFDNHLKRNKNMQL